MGLDDTLHIDCMTFKYFAFYIAFHWLVTTFGIVYHVNIKVPPNQHNVHLSEIDALE